MLVIQLVSHFDMGGAERIAINIAKSRSGVEYHMVEVVTGDSDYTKSFIKELEENNIQYHRSGIKQNKLAIVLFPFRLYKLINSIRPDVIHTHTEMPDLALFLSASLFPWKLKNIKIVRTLHNTLLWDKWKYIGKMVEKFMIGRKANVSNSNMITETYLKEFGPDKNLKMIYNGFEPVEQESYKHLSTNRINILFAGRFVPQKGISKLIECVKTVSKEKFFFHIAGKGELKEEIMAAIGSQENVSVTDPISNLSRYLGSFDYVFIPSIHEGLNSLSIEASLSKTPVIINNIDGLNETVPPNYELKAENNSIEDYKRIFKRIENEDPSVFVNETFTYALSHFSMRIMQNQYENLYNEK